MMAQSTIGKNIPTCTFCHNSFEPNLLVRCIGCLKGLCHELRGYSVITHSSLERQETPLNQACKYRVLVAFQLLLVSH